MPPSQVEEPARVVIVEYDPSWPERFEEEGARIRGVVGPLAVGLEHIGSTAVPGLAAKPILDILLGIPSLERAADLVDPLASLGYEYVPEYEVEIPERRYFRKGPSGARTHHVHAVEHGGRFWDRHLLFRDFLRTHPRRAAEYATLKRGLAERYGRDREGYTEAKSDFIRSIEEQALRWRAGDRASRPQPS